MPTNKPKPDPTKPPAEDTTDAERQRQDEQLDKALEETFPASDPIAIDPAP